MDEHWSLAIDLLHQHVPWLTQRLAELGYESFEQRESATGAQILIYDAQPERLEEVRARLRALAERSRADAGFDAEPLLRLELSEVDAGWQLEWTKHLEPVSLTERTRLYPHAPLRAPLAGELYLEPAFAFGFGEHPSTRLIATWLEQACLDRPGRSVLDVGCGTGVLSLLARQSGAGQVLGVDVSAPAVLAARANAALNGMTDVLFLGAPLGEVEGHFDLVVANIEASALSGLAESITTKLDPAGDLALAGFIAEQCAALVERYAQAGIRLELRDRADDWCLLVGRRTSLAADG